MADQDTGTAFAELVEQLRTEVGQVVFGLMSLLGPTEDMLLLEQTVDSRAQMWAAALLGDDDHLAAETVTDLVNVLWPRSEPTPDWWRTPLGRAAARSVGHPGAEVVSYSVAGAMLGCSKQNITKLLAAGRLTKGPTGGVTTASVREELREVEVGTRRSRRATARSRHGDGDEHGVHR